MVGADGVGRSNDPEVIPCADSQNQTEGAVVLRDEAVNFELCRDHAAHLSPPLGLRRWVGLVLLGYHAFDPGHGERRIQPVRSDVAIGGLNDYLQQLVRLAVDMSLQLAPALTQVFAADVFPLISEKVKGNERRGQFTPSLLPLALANHQTLLQLDKAHATL